LCWQDGKKTKHRSPFAGGGAGKGGQVEWEEHGIKKKTNFQTIIEGFGRRNCCARKEWHGKQGWKSAAQKKEKKGYTPRRYVKIVSRG